MTISNITQSQLKVLIAVVESGSFSRAAEQLGMTQSGASQAIKSLETALAARLLVRKRDGVFPTQLGASVLADARDAVASVERMREHCAGSRALISGQLRIGSVSSAAARVLPQKLAEYCRRHPGIELTLMEGTDAEVCRWVEESLVDIGLSAESSSKTTGRVVVEDEFVALVETKHRLAKRRHIRLAEIAREPFLMSASGCEPEIRRIFRRAGFAPRVSLHIRDTATLVKMVGQGLGVTLMPELAVPETADGVAQLSLQPRNTRKLKALTSRGRHPSPAAAEFLGLLE